MNVHDFINRAVQTIKSNSPELLTGFGVVGVLTTSYFVGRASYVASEIIHADEAAGGTHGDPKERFKERFKQTWRLYVPAGVSGAVTIACIVGAKKTGGQRTAAAVAAYSLTEKAFSDYKEKVVEQIGVNKEQKIRDEIAHEKVLANPSREVVILGSGHVLCCELYTHRYFRSDMESLRKANNDINEKIVHQLYVELGDFYDAVDLPHTSNSGNMGWDSDKLLELQFSTVLAEDGEPCLAFDYNYLKPLK